MLKLKDIVKHYYVGDQTVEALKGINLNFRKNEFVAILGPSGCGKTTTLNIIGGLDHYTSGDLVINGVSTKDYKDYDWDVYRNHRIGFVFQSYNLIPHQTILGNVELALTISGISKKERVERAKKALDRVGLKNQYNKHPNQLSGGQCQRVAIARALVNEPDILLADEPTGALDTETSVQIMELIKEISKEKLVIMVTHNPELAEKYSTRIVSFVDGLITNDTNPFTDEEEKEEILSLKNETVEVVEPKKKNEKAKMSMWTAFKLSARNLWSKRARTIMIGIAGSIGIIGVSTVLGVSQGVNDYIDSMQDDMLSGNPIAITPTAYDYSILTSGLSFDDIKTAADKVGGYVYTRQLLDYLVTNRQVLENIVHTNTITDDYVSYVKTMPTDYYSDIQLSYGIDISKSVFTTYEGISDSELEASKLIPTFNKKIDLLNNMHDQNGFYSVSAINDIYAQAIAYLNDTHSYAMYASTITGLSSPISQIINNNDYILSQYDLIDGTMPKKANDVVLVLSKDQSLADISLAQLGFYSQTEFYKLVSESLFSNTTLKAKKEFSFDTVKNKKFTWYPNNLLYDVDSNGNVKYNYCNYKNGGKDIDLGWESLSEIDLDNPTNEKGVDLNVCGILKLKSNVSYGSLNSGLLYTEDFARYVTYCNSLDKDSTTNYYSKLNSYNSLSSKIDYSPVTTTLTEEDFNNGDYFEIAYTVDMNYNGMSIQYPVFEKSSLYTEGKAYFTATPQGGYYDLNFAWINFDANGNLYKGAKCTRRLELSAMANIASAISSYMGFSSTSSESTMTANDLGLISTAKSIYIYPKNFGQKDNVTNYLDKWNETINTETGKEYTVTINVYDGNNNCNYYRNVTSQKDLGISRLKTSGDEVSKVSYTDSVGVIINLISTMVNIVTYALVAFTALSLVVSSVMIAIITYVSVMERIKEIGVIRSLGGRKKDVSHLFNAETLIIGFTSGVIGIVISYILCFIINVIVKALSNGTILSMANLTPLTALIMILVSVLLTTIAGFVPSRSAAKKDPVVALRTE